MQNVPKKFNSPERLSRFKEIEKAQKQQELDKNREIGRLGQLTNHLAIENMILTQILMSKGVFTVDEYVNAKKKLFEEANRTLGVEQKVEKVEQSAKQTDNKIEPLIQPAQVTPGV